MGGGGGGRGCTGAAGSVEMHTPRLLYGIYSMCFTQNEKHDVEAMLWGGRQGRGTRLAPLRPVQFNVQGR